MARCPRRAITVGELGAPARRVAALVAVAALGALSACRRTPDQTSERGADSGRSATSTALGTPERSRTPSPTSPRRPGNVDASSEAGLVSDLVDPSREAGADASRAPAKVRIVPTSPALQATVCGSRRPCRLARVRLAGTDSQGRALYVATADRGLAPRDDGTSAHPAAPGVQGDPPTLSVTDVADVAGPVSFGQSCHRYEFWLIAEGRAARTPQLLYESCNDGYGAAGVGEDRVEVGDREVTIQRSGGSNWRWTNTWRLSLDPLRVRDTEGLGTFTGGWHDEREEWSWDDFRGAVTWSAPTCDAQGSPPEGEFEDDADAAPGPEHRFLSIPQVTVEPEFERGGWRTTRLGDCAAHVDSSGTRGFVTHGGVGVADDASLAVVASRDGVLFLELHDDQWTGPTDHWVADDHVELWLAAEPRTYMDACIPRSDDAPPKQWAVRASDGRVFAGFGQPAPADLAVERASVEGVVRMRIVLPRESQAISVVYSDGDDGVHQKRLIATSAVRFGDRASLGELHALSADDAVCTARGGVLRTRSTRRFARDRAVVGGDD
jgi:hypothetical protein